MRTHQKEGKAHTRKKVSQVETEITERGIGPEHQIYASFGPELKDHCFTILHMMATHEAFSEMSIEQRRELADVLWMLRFDVEAEEKWDNTVGALM